MRALPRVIQNFPTQCVEGIRGPAQLSVPDLASAQPGISRSTEVLGAAMKPAARRSREGLVARPNVGRTSGLHLPVLGVSASNRKLETCCNLPGVAVDVTGPRRRQRM